MVVKYTVGLNPGPGVELRLETSAGDIAAFPIWQPDVPTLSTAAGTRQNPLRMLEDWLPESRLRWGKYVRFEEIHDTNSVADSED